MRDLRRNRRFLYYALFVEDEEIMDEEGFFTGETTPLYTEPEAAQVNISPAAGAVDNQMFGGFTDYTHVIATAREFPFDEQTKFWLGKDPELSHNFVCVKVAKSINCYLYALRAVKIQDPVIVGFRLRDAAGYGLTDSAGFRLRVMG